jgi:hypothetical protein
MIIVKNHFDYAQRLVSDPDYPDTTLNVINNLQPFSQKYSL